MVELVSTGNSLMDSFLGGGYESDIITTIYGPPGTGKTTLCLLASIAAVRNNKKVLFVDTEGGFSVTRLKQLSGELQILEKLFILKPTSFEEQIKVINRIKQLVSDAIGLIVVDTISMLYRVEISKGVDIRYLANELGIQVSCLNEIARTKSIPVLITNQIYSDFEEKGMVKMIGGDLLKYSSKCLIELKKFDNGKRKAVLRKHRSLAEGKFLDFVIQEKGFTPLHP